MAWSRCIATAIKKARLVANPGCYTSCAQLAVTPLLKAKAIVPDEIVIDAKSGMTGAGRAAKEEMLFSEVSEGFHAYGVGHHRHMAELDQEFSAAAGREVVVSFTPHLVPMNRGILSTIYVRGTRGKSAEDLHAILLKYYAKEPFVHVLPFGQTPQTRHVRGSNMTFIGVAKDRVPGRAIVISALDNLVKGASGQAVQNMNLMLGYPETTGPGAGRAVSVGLSLPLPALRGREGRSARFQTSRNVHNLSSQFWEDAHDRIADAATGKVAVTCAADRRGISRVACATAARSTSTASASRT